MTARSPARGRGFAALLVLLAARPALAPLGAQEAGTPTRTSTGAQAGAQTQAQSAAQSETGALRAAVKELERALEDLRARLAEVEQRQPGASAAAPAGDQPVEAAPPAASTPSGPDAPPVPSTTGATAAGSPDDGFPDDGSPDDGTPDDGSPEDGNRVVIAEQRIDLPEPDPRIMPYGPSPIPDYDTFNDFQRAAPRPDNKPIDPELKGFIPIPGTLSMLRFGGSARLDAIYDFADNGNPNQFIPSSIPVDGQPGEDGGDRATLHTKGTRISFEARRPVGEEGTLRIYNENDFFDDSASSAMRFRVRHFYGQAWNLLIGQTFSAFMNIDAWPDVLDYAGPNALINRRQPQVRYSPTIYDGVGEMHLVFSIEQPESDIDTAAAGLPPGSEGISRAPDGVAAWRWEGDAGHLQVAGLFRSIAYEADNAPDDSVFGWGASASGGLHLLEKDKLLWQVAYGEGIARYVNDLGGADLDAAPNASGRLQALPVFAAVAGYTHQWSETFRSTVSYGYLDVDPRDSLGGFAIENTHYGSANLVWQPTTSFRMGIEYLYGSKDTLDGADGEGHRLLFVFRYDLIR